MKFYERLKGLREFDILSGLDKVYQKIERRQRVWKKSVGSLCPEGCGNCCVPFEPHVYDCEAMYMAMYLIACEPAAAKAIRDGTYPMQREAGGSSSAQPPIWDQILETQITIQ